ncbi:MAG: Mini-ribonuclease 3 [Clostridia bacterium]|nr:Mini-ribonuclease 3 [Clostridia bacterium]
MFKINSALDSKSVKNLSSLTLAFIGDAVYSLYVRKRFVFEKDDKGYELNKKTADVVCASSQAKAIEKLLTLLTEEEIDVYKRGRNVKKGTRAKHATVSEYNKSTGFEALVGYLYLLGEIERLEYLLEQVVQEN